MLFSRNIRKQRTQLIEENINPVMSEIGFSPITLLNDADGDTWGAERREGTLIQWISIMDLVGELRLCISANTYAVCPLYASKTDVQKGFSEIQEGWKYRTEDEFREIILAYRDILRQHALDSMKILCISPIEARPYPETSKYLYDYHETIYEDYMKKHDIKAMNLWEKLQYLDDQITQLKQKPFKDAENQLVEIAAVWAVELLKAHGGKWEWDGTYQNAVISGLSRSKRLYVPLNMIIIHWREPEGYIRFKNVLAGAKFYKPGDRKSQVEMDSSKYL